jgi:hypothetical protein
MAPRRKVRQGDAQLAFEALSIEGGLLSPEWLAKVAQLQADHQAATDYRIPKGLNLRDEIGRYWRIAQAHWNELLAGIKANAGRQALSDRFVLALLREVLGFGAVTQTGPLQVGERSYPVGHRALDGRVPVVIAPAGSGLDTLAPEFGDGGRRRSAFGLTQEYLNAEEQALWGIATDGSTLRILRDNASLTRPAWIEADLARIFAEERYADFAALWLLAHETRFGASGHPVSDCPLEVWRAAGREEGTRAREYLRDGVEEALRALGRGFLSHPENQPLRSALQGGKLTRDGLYQQLLRLVYRLIFLLTAEERGVLHPPEAATSAKALYEQGYGLRRLRDRAVKRSAHDRFADLWEGLKIVLRGVARGEPRLALPALGGLFDADQCPDLDAAKLENRGLLAAVFKLSWLRQDSSLSRVNWRDMGPEELGSVYESLLELVPVVPEDGHGFSFATGDETKGNARKTTGSYYTPDSLVQVLLDSALEPVVQQTIAANPEKSAEALLQLSIVDPACGSGHFLLAAARRLAAHVARLQANGTPSAAEYRHALRQVVSRCLYGVDLNPMAVELCRVSLWMEAVEPGRPLSFLDSHIQRGNALLGATPELMAKGIPEAAFEPIEGDDKKTASLLKKKNKAAAEGQRGFDALWAKPAEAESAEVAKAVAALEAAPDASLEDVAGKEARWEGLQRSFAFTHQKFIADAWCAAFVWPKPPTEPKKVDPVVAAAPTNDLWRQIRDGQGKPPSETVETVAELASQYHLFHWHLAFPQVFARGGFDVVLGNPPWEKVKIQEAEWFAEHRPDIAKAPNAAARKGLIARLEREGDPLFREFGLALRRSDALSNWLRCSDRFPLCGRGDINAYSVFSETALALASGTGACGIVVPSGILADDTTKLYFKEIQTRGWLSQAIDFENNETLFPGVGHGRMRFCLLTIHKGNRSKAARLFFLAKSVLELSDRERWFELGPDDAAAINPNSETCPVFLSRRDAEITKAVYRRFPVFRTEKPDSSPWGARLHTLFHMTADAALFKTGDALRNAGWSQEGREYRRGGDVMLPIIEGKMTSFYDHRAAHIRLNPDAPTRQQQTEDTTDDNHRIPEFFPEAYLWAPRDEARQRFADSVKQRWAIAFKRVTSATNWRTMVACVVPEDLAVSYTLYLVEVGEEHARKRPCLLAVLNSFAFDYFVRQKTMQPSLPIGPIYETVMPPPGAFDRKPAWSDVVLSAWVASRVAELTSVSSDLATFAEDVLGEPVVFRWDPSRREILQAELDAMALHLFGLSRPDAEHIFETFPKVRDYDEKVHGVYRTKRVILEIYDAMAQAIRTGTPYQTRLDPPPADPRVAHLPRVAVRAAKPPKVAVLPDRAWQRPGADHASEVGVVLAALLKAFGRATPIEQVRLAAVLALHPALALASVSAKEAAEWRRLVGDEAEPLPRGVAAIAQTTDRAWGDAVRHLRGNRLLVEDAKAQTWAPGAGLAATIESEGWADGRVRWVVELLGRRGADAVLQTVEPEIRRWVSGAKAA